MKITIYTINDCPFCKQEKEYLGLKSLAFEEKNLESNKEYLTEMLAISNNFAGAPVTKIEKDDGQVAVLKGFTKEEFDTTLGGNVQQANAQMTPPPVPSTEPTVPQPTPAPTIPTPPPVETPPPPTMPEPPVSEPEPTVVPPSTPPVAEAQSQMTPPPPLSGASTSPAPTTPSAPQPDEALNSILNDLQKKVNEIPPQPPQAPAAPVV